MNLGVVLSNPDLAEQFSLLRSTGEFVAGGWQEKSQQIQVSGISSNATPEDLVMIPEGDRVTGARVFYTKTRIYATRREPEEGTSDIFLYEGQEYRVMAVFPYAVRGFWKAIAVRMSGV